MIDNDKLKQLSEHNEKWKYLIDESKQTNFDFAVSNFGRVYSMKYNRIVRQYNNKHTGYNYFYLSDIRSYGSDTMNVHRAVALTWLDYPTFLKDDFPVVDHINEIKTDNRVSNLQWISQQENLTRATVQQRKVEQLKKTVEIRKKMQEKDALIERLTNENRELKTRLLKYEDAMTMLEVEEENKNRNKKQKFDYRQFF